MSRPGEALAGKCPKRLQSIFLRACAVTLLVWLVLYTLADVNARPDPHSWSLSNVLRNAANKMGAIFKQTEMSSSHARKRILVLLWNNYFSKKIDWIPSTLDLHCPVTECDTTSNRSLLQNSSAVILHWRNMDTADLPPTCNTSHCPPLVLFNKEAPPHTSKTTLRAVEGRVQWTATYRWDSDIFAPYGKVVARNTPNYMETVLDHTKRLVCWLVSNCDTPSKREVFVSELEEYLDVDMYGRCDEMKCPHPVASDCYQWLSKRCLFYLSLENSLCKDYTTEKLYNALSTDMIPVVMGNSSNYRHLPPHSYINAADFSGPKELAEYLIEVGKDQELYSSYLSWKRNYEAKDHSYRWFCDLCEKLHSSEAKSLGSRRNLVSWWFDQSSCWSWKNL